MLRSSGFFKNILPEYGIEHDKIITELNRPGLDIFKTLFPPVTLPVIEYITPVLSTPAQESAYIEADVLRDSIPDRNHVSNLIGLSVDDEEFTSTKKILMVAGIALVLIYLKSRH